MITMLERRETVTGRRNGSKSSLSLIEQKRILDQATRKTAGLAARAFERTLHEEMEKKKQSSGG